MTDDHNYPSVVGATVMVDPVTGTLTLMVGFFNEEPGGIATNHAVIKIGVFRMEEKGLVNVISDPCTIATVISVDEEKYFRADKEPA